MSGRALSYPSSCLFYNKDQAMLKLRKCSQHCAFVTRCLKVYILGKCYEWPEWVENTFTTTLSGHFDFRDGI